MSQRNLTYHLFGLVRLTLYPLALLYGAVVWLRNRLYDAGFFSAVEFSTPVIAVGNLSVGGTGKTPHVEYLLRLLQYRYRTATMSRGYKRRTQGFLLADEHTNALRIGDEPMQYHLGFPEVVVSVAEERMTGIPGLLQKRPEVEVVILDDAYQHRSVKAGLNILITDFSKPFYEDHILPYGTLRESRRAYRRADVIIVSKCPPGLSEAARTELWRRINPLPRDTGGIEVVPQPLQAVYFTTTVYSRPYDFFTREEFMGDWPHTLAVCGIAKPAPLRTYLERVAPGVHLLTYPDHHFFGSQNLEEIKATYDAWDVPRKAIFTTEKDAARLHLHADKLREWGIPILVLPIRIEFLFGEGAAFDKEVEGYIEAELGIEAPEDAEDYGEEV